MAVTTKSAPPEAARSRLGTGARLMAAIPGWMAVCAAAGAVGGAAYRAISPSKRLRGPSAEGESRLHHHHLAVSPMSATMVKKRWREARNRQMAVGGRGKTCFVGHILENPFSKAAEKGPS